MVDLRGLSAAKFPDISQPIQSRRIRTAGRSWCVVYFIDREKRSQWSECDSRASHCHQRCSAPIFSDSPLRKFADSAIEQRYSPTAESTNGLEVKETRLDASLEVGIRRKRKRDDQNPFSNCVEMDREIRQLKFERMAQCQRSLVTNYLLLEHPFR